MSARTGRVEFTDSVYRRSHGSAPRGWGCWAFQASRTRVAYEADLSGPVLWPPYVLTLTKAKRWAAVEASRIGLGAPFLAVMP